MWQVIWLYESVRRSARIMGTLHTRGMILGSLKSQNSILDRSCMQFTRYDRAEMSTNRRWTIYSRGYNQFGTLSTSIRAYERHAISFLSLALKLTEALHPSVRRFKACEGVDGCIFWKIVPARKSRLPPSLPPSVPRPRFLRDRSCRLHLRSRNNTDGNRGSRANRISGLPGMIGSTRIAQEPKCQKNHRQFECAWQMCNNR